MSPRRRWTNAARAGGGLSPVRGPVRSAGRSANSGLSSDSKERNASSLPLCGVAVTRIRWRSGSAASPARAGGADGGPIRFHREGAGVGLVDNHQLGAGPQEVIAAAGRT